MKAYFSIARSARKVLDQEVEVVRQILAANRIVPVVFVDQYHFEGNQEKEMMLQAMSDIDACDLLIAEVSEKAIGVGLEAGYAKGKGKTIIYLRRIDAEHSTTVSGISDHHIFYRDGADLKTSFEKIVKLWIVERG